MALMDPDVYKLMLQRTNWDKPNEVHYIQAVAADDVTLTNLYREYVESNNIFGDEEKS